MSSPRLWKTWRVSVTLLRHARASLPPPSASVTTDFDRLDQNFAEYLEHNEHELALNTLEEMGKLCLPRGGFWRDLERAANNMGLTSRVADLRVEFNKALERTKSDK